MQAAQALVPITTKIRSYFCAKSSKSITTQRVWGVRGQEEQARKSFSIALGLAHRGMVGPSKGAAAPGQAVSPQCPALSRKRSQEVQGAGSRAASAWLSLLPLFQMMRPTDDILKELCKPAVLQRLLKIESLPLLWLVLRGLDLLSERPEMVSRT